jgi:hypothetical protein
MKGRKRRERIRRPRKGSKAGRGGGWKKSMAIK